VPSLKSPKVLGFVSEKREQDDQDDNEIAKQIMFFEISPSEQEMAMKLGRLNLGQVN